MYDENRNPDPTVFYEGADETSSYSEAVSTTIVQSPSPLRLNSVIKKPDVLPESIFDICIQDEIPLLPRSILSLEPAATSNHSETQTAPLDINGNESSSRDRNDLQELSVLIRAVVDKINCIQQNQEDREKINSIIAPLKQFHLGHNSESGAFNAPPGFHGKSNSAFNGIDTDQRSFISPFAKASNANPNTATTNVFICSNYSHNNNNNLQQNLFNQGSSAGFNSNPPASLSLVQPPARSLFKSSLPAPEPTLQSNRIQSNNPFLESQDSLVSQKPVENGQNPFTASIKNPFQNSTRNPFATSTTHETESIYYHQTDEERLKQDSSEEQPSVGETTQRTVFNSQDRPNGLFEDLFSNDSKDYSLTLKTPNQSKVTSFNDLFSNNAPSDHETSLSFRPEPKTTLFSDLFSNSSSEQNSPRKMPQESNNNWAPVDIQEQGSYASIDQLFTGEATPQEDNDLMRSFAITYAEPPVKWSTATEEVNPGATLFNNATDTNSSEDCQEVQTVACLRDYQQLTCQMTDEIPVYENGLILCGTLDLSQQILNKKIVLIHYKDEGYLSTEEFVKFFTKFTSVEHLKKLLHFHEVAVNFVEICRASHPMMFQRLDETIMSVPRDVYDKIVGDLHLTPIRSILRILNKMDIVTEEEIAKLDKGDHIYTSGTVIYDALTLIFGYRKLKEKSLKLKDSLYS